MINVGDHGCVGGNRKFGHDYDRYKEFKLVRENNSDTILKISNDVNLTHNIL